MKKSHKLLTQKAVRSYHPPAIAHRGVLQQFAGSPLGKLQGNPLNLPDQR